MVKLLLDQKINCNKNITDNLTPHSVRWKYEDNLQNYRFENIAEVLIK